MAAGVTLGYYAAQLRRQRGQGLREACAATLMANVIDGVKSDATLQAICDGLCDAFGEAEPVKL